MQLDPHRRGTGGSG
jgi:hypothetical protein